MSKLRTLSQSSVIIGNFRGKQICFLLGSCHHGPNGVIITELKNLEKEKPGVVPNTLKLSHRDLITSSVPKHIIEAYLKIPSITNNQHVKKANNQQNVKRGTYAFAH